MPDSGVLRTKMTSTDKAGRGTPMHELGPRRRFLEMSEAAKSKERSTSAQFLSSQVKSLLSAEWNGEEDFYHN